MTVPTPDEQARTLNGCAFTVLIVLTLILSTLAVIRGGAWWAAAAGIAVLTSLFAIRNDI